MCDDIQVIISFILYSNTFFSVIISFQHLMLHGNGPVKGFLLDRASFFISPTLIVQSGHHNNNCIFKFFIQFSIHFNISF